MRKQTVILLLLPVLILVVSIALIEVLSKGNQTGQAKILPTVQPAEMTVTPFYLINRVLPTQTPTPDLSQPRNCTYTYYFWRDHPESWPDMQEIAEKSITKDQAARLMQLAGKDPIVELQRILYVALLNIHSGADRKTIDKTIQDASGWLDANPPGTPLTEFKKSAAAYFMRTLEDYNNGLIGPQLCPDQPHTPTPTATALIQGQVTIEYSPTPTITPQPRQPDATPTRTPLLPKQRPTATRLPPENPPLLPPSSTPISPTSTLSRTPIPRTSTPILTSIPPSSTSTDTPFLPTRTATPSHTPFPPTNTALPPSQTPLPPTDTSTPIPSPNTPIPPSITPTSNPPTNTPTPEPLTSTPTSEPPTSTHTPDPPTSTPIPEPASTETQKAPPTHRPPTSTPGT